MFHKNEIEGKDSSGMAGVQSFCATSISLILKTLKKKKKVTSSNKKDVLVFLQPQILDPGGSEETDGTAVENTITVLRAT